MNNRCLNVMLQAWQEKALRLTAVRGYAMGFLKQ